MARDYAKTIGALIAMAEDESLTDEARSSYRLKAEQLMREYRISEEEAIAQDISAATPIEKSVTLMEFNAFSNPLRQKYADLWYSIARHAGVRSIVVTDYTDEDFTGQLIAKVVGYDMDIRLAEFLWTAARLVFITRIDVRVNRELGDQENCYFMRASGMARIDIAAALWGEETRTKAAPHARVQKLYVAECEKRGEQPTVAGRGIQVGLYREAYAEAFVRQFGWRLQEARDAADSTGGALEMHGRKQRVDQAFYERFPQYRPMSDEERAKWRLKAQEERDNCPKCKRRKDGRKCTMHRPYEATEKDRRAYYRKYESQEARAGAAAGAAAAEAVNVQRTAGERAQRTDAAPERVALGG